jgi:hypothetical protein
MPRTREQDREYQREYKRRKAAESHESRPAMMAHDGPGAGVESAESLVRAELDSLPASKTLLSLVAAALAMARVLDDAAAVPQHPAAAGQLRQVMAEVRAAKSEAGASPLTVLRGGRGA